VVGSKLIKLFVLPCAFASFALIQSCAADDDLLAGISLPPGFKIEIYADVPYARSLAVSDNGTVFVGTRRSGTVHAVTPDREVIEVVSGLKTPNGVAVFEGDLYVAELTRITRYDDIEARLYDKPDGVVLDIDLPSETHHGPRYIAFGPDNKLYITIGAPCNICVREGYGQIVRMNSDGSEREVVASGVRNSVGIAWHPQTEELWFTDNGRDMLGDDLPADELNHAPVAGLDFGFPYCHAGEVLDPEFGGGKDCSDFSPPAQKLGPHVAALGLKFYTEMEFPSEYQGQIFIAERGSWNRSEKIGYRVSLVRLQDGIPVSYETFAEGWLQGQSVAGRPVDLLVLADGSMLLSDDQAGKVYQIRYEGSD
jgi:glucose/arabinose dehydrogenase